MKHTLLREFRQKAIGEEQDQQAYMEQIDKTLEEHFHSLKARNLEKLKKHYEDQLQPKLDQIEAKLHKYENFYQFQNDLYKLKTNLDPNMADHFDKACLSLYQQACEKLGEHITHKKNAEIQACEKKCHALEASLEQHKQANANHQKKIDQDARELHKARQELDAKDQTVARLHSQLEKLKADQMTFISNSDKQIALLTQEKGFQHKEIKAL